VSNLFSDDDFGLLHEKEKKEDILYEMNEAGELLKGFLEEKPTSSIFSKSISLSSVPVIVPLGELSVPEDEMRSIVEEVVETKTKKLVKEIEELIDKKVEKAIEKWLKRALAGT
jgi:hypothetical protein